MLNQLVNLIRNVAHCNPLDIAAKYVSRETIKKAINVILRVPALFLAEIWLRTDIGSITIPMLQTKLDNEIVDKAIRSFGTHDYAVVTLYYSVILLALALALLPLRKLVQLYMYIISCGLLIAAHHCSTLYVDEEKSHAPSPRILNAAHHRDQSRSVLEDVESLRRAGIHAAVQVVINALIGYLLNFRSWQFPVVSIYILPMLARVGSYPAEHLHRVHNFAFLFEMIVISYFLFKNVPKVLDTLKALFQDISFAIQLYGWMTFGTMLWTKRGMPLQFLTFWITLFCVQIIKYFSHHDHMETFEGYVVMILTCMASTCVTPITLIGLCITISYTAFAMLTGTRVFLMGRSALLEEGTVIQRGYSEGFTMFLLAIQTGLLELKTSQRAFLMCIVLFIVVSSLVQSMFEITDPFLLSLGAAQSTNIGRHIRAVFLSTFLWMFPVYMAWQISLFFDMDFWLMVVISSCVLTSLQVMGSLVTYALFMYDALCNASLERLDDFVFYAKATTRTLEFIVAVFVVCYGVRESMFGEWSWVNASILIIHCYFNVWQRLQVGWRTYLLRRESSKKVESLRDASSEELRMLNDVCSVCYQPMTCAKITTCRHYFHGVCLRKWLYVQEKCPMCHALITCEEDNVTSDEMSQENVDNAANEMSPENVENDEGNDL